MSLVKRIKKLCDERKVTFAEVERNSGISNGQIRRWDTSSPKSENVEKVADYFNVSVDYLLGRTDEKIHFDFLGVDESKDPDIRTIQRAANKMTADERKKAIKILEAAFDDLFEDD